jgi:putative ABC transport system ATP-binding protein
MRDGGAAIEVCNLSHTYRSGAGSVRVLDALDLQVPPGGYVALQGSSGAGKSTLLSILGGLERPQAGRALVDGVDLGELNGDALAAFRRRTVGFVFQHFGLLEPLTAQENVELACSLAGRSRRDRRARAEKLLSAVGLGGRTGHRPVELSGGERQRVAMARALANDPRLLLADEPTGNLDEDSALAVIELLESIQLERACTLVLVTHNRALAGRAPVRLRLDRGRLESRPR